MSKILVVVKWILTALLLAAFLLAAFQAATFHPNPNPPAFSETFSDPTLSNWPLKAVDGLGTAKPPPYHGAELIVKDGTLRLQISPDPNFDKEGGKPVGDALAAENYNNIFITGAPSFAPTWNETVFYEFRMKIDKGYKGTTGFWIESKDTFDGTGRMVTNGFNAFGISFTSADSDKAIAGLKFEYAKGFIPLCIGNISADPFVWNVYQIKWSKILGFIDRFDVSVNGVYQGSCFIPYIGNSRSEIQFWADNFKILPGFTLSHINPTEVQGVEFDSLSIRVKK